MPILIRSMGNISIKLDLTIHKEIYFQPVWKNRTFVRRLIVLNLTRLLFIVAAIPTTSATTTTVAPVLPTVAVSLGLTTSWSADYSNRASTKFVTLSSSISSKIVSELRKHGNSKVSRVSVTRFYRDPVSDKIRVDLSVVFESGTTVDSNLVTSVSRNIKSSVDDGSLNSIGVDSNVSITSKGNLYFLG